MAAAAYSKMNLRRGQLEIVEERIRHVVVVMLPRVDNARLAPGLPRELMIKRRDLHEVWARGCDEMNG